MSTIKSAREPRSSPWIKIFKGLILSLGAGALFRAGARQSRGGGELDERLNRAENRLGEIERARSESTPEGLQHWIESVDERCSGQIASLGERLTSFEKQIPELISVAVNSRIAEAETRIKAELGEMQKQTLQAMLRTVETRVAEGIGHVETSLATQSREIGELVHRMDQTDANLLRILSIVERKDFSQILETAARG